MRNGAYKLPTDVSLYAKGKVIPATIIQTTESDNGTEVELQLSERIWRKPRKMQLELSPSIRIPI